jgi:hypothetical protein
MADGRHSLTEETNMRAFGRLAACAAIVMAIAASNLPANAQVPYTINGLPVPYQVAVVMAAKGLPAGHYLMDGMGNLSLVQPALPPANPGNGGNWSVRGPISGFGVGGSGGCIYAGDWSNC